MQCSQHNKKHPGQHSTNTKPKFSVETDSGWLSSWLQLSAVHESKHAGLHAFCWHKNPSADLRDSRACKDCTTGSEKKERQTELGKADSTSAVTVHFVIQYIQPPPPPPPLLSGEVLYLLSSFSQFYLFFLIFQLVFLLLLVTVFFPLE